MSRITVVVVVMAMITAILVSTISVTYVRLNAYAINKLYFYCGAVNSRAEHNYDC